MFMDLIKLQEYGGAVPCLFRVMATHDYGSPTCLYACKGLLPKQYDYITVGIYECCLTTSKKFTQLVGCTGYEITEIDGHSRILIHNGNGVEDSKGCLLIGKVGQDSRRVYESRKTMVELYRVLRANHSGTLPEKIPLLVSDYRQIC